MFRISKFPNEGKRWVVRGHVEILIDVVTDVKIIRARAVIDVAVRGRSHMTSYSQGGWGGLGNPVPI